MLRGVERRAAHVAGAGADRPARAACWPAAARSRCAPSTPGSRSCCVLRRLDLLAELGLRPDMQLLEDLDDLRPELMRRFHADVLADAALLADYRALASQRGRTTLQKWLDAAWQRRVEIELADAAGTLATSVEPAAACYAECAGLAHPAALVRRPTLVDAAGALARQLASRGKLKSDEAAQGLVAALALPDDRAAFDATAQRTLHRRGHAAGSSSAICRHRPSSARCSTASARRWPSRTRMTSMAAWCDWRGRCLPSTPRSSSSAAWSTWPTSSAWRWRCWPITRSPAGCSSGSTRACATC